MLRCLLLKNQSNVNSFACSRYPHILTIYFAQMKRKKKKPCNNSVNQGSITGSQQESISRDDNDGLEKSISMHNLCRLGVSKSLGLIGYIKDKLTGPQTFGQLLFSLDVH